MVDGSQAFSARASFSVGTRKSWGTSTCTGMASACTPASVRPAATARRAPGVGCAVPRQGQAQAPVSVGRTERTGLGAHAFRVARAVQRRFLTDFATDR